MATMFVPQGTLKARESKLIYTHKFHFFFMISRHTEKKEYMEGIDKYLLINNSYENMHVLQK